MCRWCRWKPANSKQDADRENPGRYRTVGIFCRRKFLNGSVMPEFKLSDGLKSLQNYLQAEPLQKYLKAV